MESFFMPLQVDEKGRVILTGIPERDAAVIHELIRVFVACEREECADIIEGKDADWLPRDMAKDLAALIRRRT